MLRAGNGTEGGKRESSKFGAEIKSAVNTELELMLEAPVFAQSGRCKRFLSYIVMETLSGNAVQLKERSIGVCVFDRPSDYDTGGDSIVRVTANELRKRIDQFYRDSPVAHPIQIELPKGAYVPEFRIQPSQRAKESEERVETDPSGQAERQVGLATEKGFSFVGSEAPAIDETPFAVTEGRKRLRDRRVVVYSLILILLLVSGIAVLGIWRTKTQKSGPQVWKPFLHSSGPILICVDTHDLHLTSASSSPDGQRFVDQVLHKQIIALDDVSVISSMAAMLGKKGIPFRVVGAEQTSLTEFRRQPGILIGAIDNKWTLLLSQSLRYRIEIKNPPGSVKEPIASIVDSEHPQSTPWTVDLSVPFNAWKGDYAILARMDDSTTGVPVLIEAGLGNNGSLAASELLSSGALEAELAKDRPCNGKTNFEAVVGTEIIDTKSGPPHILRLICW